MKIADNIKCKEFTYKSRRYGGQLRGQENLWVCEIWFRGKKVATVRTKTEAKKWVSRKVKEVNAVLEAARKELQNEN